MASTKSLKQKTVARINSMKAQREPFLADWKELDSYITPGLGRFEGSQPNDGKADRSNIINNEGGSSHRALVSGMTSGLTNPGRPWFRLTIPGLEFAVSHEVNVWLRKVEVEMRKIFHRSNLYEILPLTYEDTSQFGLNAFAALEDDETVLRFYHYKVGEYSLGIDKRNKIDSIARDLVYTVGQLVERFGIDNVSDEVKKKYEDNDLDSYIQVVHYVGPNNDVIPDDPTFEGMPVVSLYFENGKADDKFLSKGGFEENPIITPRWRGASGSDVYSTSCPGMDALSEIKQLQLMETDKLDAIAKQVEPPLQGGPDVKSHQSNLFPGGVSVYEGVSGKDGGLSTIYNVNINIRDLIEAIREVKESIKDIFFKNLFLMFSSSDRREVTATEIDAKQQEKLSNLGPVLESFNNSLLDPLIDRTFAVMVRKELVPEIPEEILGLDLKVEFISVLAQAQKAVGIDTIDRFTAFVANTAGISPDALDIVDFDKIVVEYAERLGLDPDLLKDSKEIKAIRDARQKQIEAERQAAFMSESAEMAKNASAVQTGEGDKTLATDVLNSGALDELGAGQ